MSTTRARRSASPKLVHIAKPADLDGLHAPDEIPLLQPFTEDKVVTLPFVSIDDTRRRQRGRGLQGRRRGRRLGGIRHIRKDSIGLPACEFVCPKSELRAGQRRVRSARASRSRPRAKATSRTPTTRRRSRCTSIRPDFQGQNSVQVKLTPALGPADGANDDGRQEERGRIRRRSRRRSAPRTRRRSSRPPRSGSSFRTRSSRGPATNCARRSASSSTAS